MTDLLRRGQSGAMARRLPKSLDDLHGPERGVVVLPRHLCPPGLREFDVADDARRRSLYGIVPASSTAIVGQNGSRSLRVSG